jgi:cytochrome c-type biogenesis protein CcmH/NrfG
MMIDRRRVGFWTRLIAIGLAVVFVGSFVVMGIGSTFPAYNIFELIGGGGDQQEQQQQGTSVQEQIEQAETAREENPEDPDILKRLAFLYIQNDQLEQASAVLEEGRQIAPEDQDIPLIQAQLYQQQAQQDPERAEELNRRAGDAYAAAAELDGENAELFLAAGDAYEAAGDQGRAVEYWNGYLEREPEGEQAEQVRQKISDLLRAGADEELPEEQP